MDTREPSPGLEPAAAGLLAEKPLAHLLAYARDRKLPGTIELVDDAGRSARIALADGQLARAWTSEPVIYLGHIFYEAGVIDGGQLSASLAELAATKALHGQLLLAKGMIDAEQLSSALRQQRLRKVHHAFTFPTTSRFAFYVDKDLIGERPHDVDPVDLLPSIWRGIAAHPPSLHLRSTLALIGARPVRLVGAIDPSPFRSAERALLDSLRHTSRTIAEIATHPGVDAPAAELLAYFLVVNRLATVEQVEAAAPEPTRPEVAVPAGEEYVRRVSFTMRAVTVQGGSTQESLGPRLRHTPVSVPATLRSPSPAPVSLAPSSPPEPQVLEAQIPEPQIPEAEQAFKQAEMLFVLGEREDALRVVRGALALAPRMSAALILLLTIEASSVGDAEEGRLREIARRVDSVINANKTCKRGRFRRGQIRKRLGDFDGAIDDFRAAMAADPNHIEAQRELKLCDRRGREARTSRSSVFDRLRG